MIKQQLWENVLVCPLCQRSLSFVVMKWGSFTLKCKCSRCDGWFKIVIDQTTATMNLEEDIYP